MGKIDIRFVQMRENSDAGVSGARLIRSRSSDDLLSTHRGGIPKPHVLNSEFFVAPGTPMPDISNSKRESLLASVNQHLKPSDGEPMDCFWDSWDAALLVNKWEEEDQQRASSLPIDEDVDYLEDIIQKGCCCDVCKSSSEGDCKALYMAAQAVKVLTFYGLDSVDLGMFSDRLTADKYQEVYRSLFLSVARTVLSIFDREDFERIYNHKKVQKEYETFHSRLRAVKGDPHVAFAEGGVKYDDLSNLREHDYCYILHQCETYTGHADMKVFPYLLLDEPKVDFIEPQFYLARRAVKKYTPLKEYYKTELTLELARQKSYSVFDGLVMKTLRCIPLDALFVYAGHQEAKYGGKKDEAFKLFVEGVINGLHRLAALKTSMLKHIRDTIQMSVGIGKSGRYSPDVVDLMMIADYERRKDCARFIRPQHLLHGFYVSGNASFAKYIKLAGGGDSEFSFLNLLKSECYPLSGRELIDIPDLVHALLSKSSSSREEAEYHFRDHMLRAAELKKPEDSQRPAWKDGNVFAAFQLKWTTDKGAKVSCST